jgi:hypothetical protein
MTGTHDVADLTSSLVDWAHSVRPDASVRVASSRPGSESSRKPSSDNEIAVRLVRVEGFSGPRSRDAVSTKLQLEYAFDLSFADPVAEQQALADLAFGILDHDELGERSEDVRAENGGLTATFVLHRRRDLPRAKPVRETKIALHPQCRVTGFVRAENGFPIARAQLQVRESDRLIVTGNDGGFAFAAPDGTTVRATVSAKGRTADVELKPGETNLITLAMEP